MTETVTDRLAPDPLERFRLDDRVALVTGASSGLGVQFARCLHAAGARVVITARRKDRLDALRAELPGTLAIAADVSDEQSREDLVAAMLEEMGTVDVLVNNAGVGRMVSIESESLETFRRALEVNVTSMWHLSKLCGNVMVRQGAGSIVNVASILGFVASAPIKQAHYTASKGAVLNLTRELAVQWARKGVRVNGLAPGWFPSEMTADMTDDEGSQRFVKTNCPMARFGEPGELDGALLLLASPAGSFITGHTIVVDGGWIAR